MILTKLFLAVWVLPCVFGVDVNTEYGIVRGQTLSVYNGETTVDLSSFNQVPFGRSTEGEGRFRVSVPTLNDYFSDESGNNHEL